MNLQQHIQQSIERQESRKPAPLYGEGFIDDMRSITTLTKYLELETWPAMWAALLVCGIQPPNPAEFIEIPQGAMGLNNCFLPGTSRPFREARRILLLWNCRENAPAMVRPADFVAWCKTKGINTDWLSDVPIEQRTASISGTVPPPVNTGSILARSEHVAAVWEVDTEEIRKRAALIQEVEFFWPTIDQDLQDGSRNGLSSEARHTKHTFWKVREALKWATQRGKLKKEKAQSFIAASPESALSPMLRALLKLD